MGAEAPSEPAGETKFFCPCHEKSTCIRAALIKQHKIVFGKRRSFGYAVSPFDRLPSKDAGSIPTRS